MSEKIPVYFVLNRMTPHPLAPSNLPHFCTGAENKALFTDLRKIFYSKADIKNLSSHTLDWDYEYITLKCSEILVILTKRKKKHQKFGPFPVSSQHVHHLRRRQHRCRQVVTAGRTCGTGLFVPQYPIWKHRWSHCRLLQVGSTQKVAVAGSSRHQAPNRLKLQSEN